MKKNILLLILLINLIFNQKILIPMDENQNNHLKAYGLAFWALKNNINVDWLLNFQGGAFIIDNSNNIQQECTLRGVTYSNIDGQKFNNILQIIE